MLPSEGTIKGRGQNEWQAGQLGRTAGLSAKRGAQCARKESAFLFGAKVRPKGFGL
jgi:hypothetical protein